MRIPVAIVNNEQPSICTTCGGKCCKESTGAIWPDQIPGVVNSDSIQYAVEHGYTVTEYTDYWGTGYYLQPQLTEHGCVFLTDTGCSFSFDDRPRICQTYIPMQDMKSCHNPEGYSAQDAVTVWSPYKEILQQFHNI